jgi:DnaJ domain
MPNFIIALIIVFGGLWLIRTFARATPAQSKGLSKKLAGGALIIVSAVLALTGKAQFAAPLFAIGLGLIGHAAAFPNGFPWAEKSSGQKSRVATSILSMELDHDSGTMSGVVLAGPFKNTRLETMSLENLQQLYKQCAGASDQSLSLLEAWLNRHKPEWRDAWKGEQRAANSGASAMSVEEALAVLGLKAGATQEDVKNAHRRLMKEFHPDRGGSDYLATKINQAKDMLTHD